MPVLTFLLLLPSVAQAADIVFDNIKWLRHDKKTGFQEWDLRAAMARPIATDEYACSKIELHTYKPVEEGGKRRQQKELFLRADKGTHLQRNEESSTNLEGNVLVELYGGSPITMTTDKARLTSRLDKKTMLRLRTIETDAKVTLVSATRTLTSDGMTVLDQADENDPKVAGDTSVMKFHKNVTMVVMGEGMGQAFPSFGGQQQKPPAETKPEPVSISCAEQLDYDRLAGLACFNTRVVLTHGQTKMTCEKLTLRFDEVKVGEKTETQLRSLLAEKDVVVTGSGQQFAGDRFEWSPATALGTLAGKPAKMYAPGNAAVADLIEFDQKTQLIKYTGPRGAEVLLELKKE